MRISAAGAVVGDHVFSNRLPLNPEIDSGAYAFVHPFFLNFVAIVDHHYL